MEDVSQLRLQEHEVTVEDDQTFWFEGRPLTGTIYELWPGGGLRSEAAYVEGVREGPAREWDLSGLLRSERVIKGNFTYSRTWFENGQLEREATTEVGILTDEIQYTEFGRVLSEFHLSAKDPKYALLEKLRRLMDSNIAADPESRQPSGRWWKLPLVFIGGAVVLLASVSMVFVRGRVWREDVGGDWVIEYQDSLLSHSGLHETLLRKRGFLTTWTVDELVQDVRYYGDDCLAYSTTRGESGLQYMTACGTRLPLQVVPPTFDEWEMRKEGLVRVRESGADEGATHRIPIRAIKQRARRQPPLQDRWFERVAQ